EMEARLPQLLLERVAAYWPATVAPPARHWIRKRMSGAILRDGIVRVAGRIADSGFVDPEVRGSFGFEKLRLHYVDGMPPATGVAGRATFTADRWHVRVGRGAVGGLGLAHATADLDLAAGRAAVDAAVEGRVAAAVAIAQKLRPGH